MPVIACPDCGRDVSMLASSCPHCGRPSPAANAPILPGNAPPQGREETVWQGSPSWALLTGRVTALLFSVIVVPLLFYMLASASTDAESRRQLVTVGWVLAIGAAVISGMTLAAGVIVLRNIHYAITNQRIIVEQGVFSKTVDEIDMRLIDDSQFAQTLLHRLLGIGHVTVMSSDKNTPRFVMRGIADPRSVRELVRTHSFQASQRQVFTRPT